VSQQDLIELFKDRQYIDEKYLFPIFPQTVGKLRVLKKRVKYFETVEENAKWFLQPHIVANKEGIGRVVLNKEREYYKIVDLIYNEDFLPIGVKYKTKDGEIKEFKTKLPDDLFEIGLDKFYLVGEVYKYNGKPILDKPLFLRRGFVIQCAICKNFELPYKKSPLCHNCYKKLEEIAMYSIEEDLFFTPKDFDTDEFLPAQLNIEKYEIMIEPDIIYMKRNDKLLPKGYQFYLPLKFD
jgi:hypothetical protein